MPVANVFVTSSIDLPNKFCTHLARIVASNLTVSEQHLDEGHVSVRVIHVYGQMIGDLEIEVIGHCFPARVEKQDLIAASIRFEVQQLVGSGMKARLWLLLPSVGYGYLRLGDGSPQA